MDIRYDRDAGAHILYDGGRIDHPTSDLFEPSWWRERSALAGQADGRGATWFVRHQQAQWALRHYRRGGLVAKLVTDRYLWLGLQRTRAWREWHLTAELHRRGLPVPAPVAARVIRRGLWYEADLITERIMQARPLSQCLCSGALTRDSWRRLGECLARFHAAGLDHADLNAHNILFTQDGRFWLIDFDRGRLRPAGAWRQANLRRLQRSLRKLRLASPRFFWQESDWAALCEGYQARMDG